MLSDLYSLSVRAAETTDLAAIQRLFEENWAVHLRIQPQQLEAKLAQCIAILVEDKINLRGAILAEPYPANNSLIIALGIHDNSNIQRILDKLFPALIDHLQIEAIDATMQIGLAPWLTGELLRFGFQVNGQIITYTWREQPLPQIRHLSQLQIRTVRRDDLPHLLEIDQLAFTDLWRKPVPVFAEAIQQADPFVVAELNQKIVAYAWCDHYRQHGHLTRLATHPAYEGRGIATNLLYHVLETLRQMKLTHISLNTQAENRRSKALYKRFGFKPTADVVNIYHKKWGNK